MACDVNGGWGVDACVRPCAATLRLEAGLATSDDRTEDRRANLHARCTLARLALEALTVGDLADVERADAASFLAWLWIDAGVPERAEALLDRLSVLGDRRDTVSALWLEAGRAWTARGRTVESLRSLERAAATAEAPDARAEAWTRVGLTRLDAGHASLASAAFTNAVSAAGASPSRQLVRRAFWGLAQARALELVAEGRWAIDGTIAWLTDRAGSEAAADLLASMLQRFVVAGRPAWAIDGYAGLIARAPGSPDACDWQARRLALIASVMVRPRALEALTQIITREVPRGCTPEVVTQAWDVAVRWHRDALEGSVPDAAAARDAARLYELVDAALPETTGVDLPLVPNAAARACARAEMLDVAGVDCESAWLDAARLVGAIEARHAALCRAAVCRAWAFRAASPPVPGRAPLRPSRPLWRIRVEAPR
jgi:hypothetical protein